MEPVRAWACSAQPVQRGPGPVLGRFGRLASAELEPGPVRRIMAAALRGPVPWSLGDPGSDPGRRQAAGGRGAGGSGAGFSGAGERTLLPPEIFRAIYSPAHFSGHSRQIRFFRAAHFCFFKFFPWAIYSPANTPICSFFENIFIIFAKFEQITQ